MLTDWLGNVSFTGEQVYQTAHPLMEWSGRGPAPPAIEAGEVRQRQAVNHHCLDCCDAYPTSGLGQTRSSGDVQVVSAFPPTATNRCIALSDAGTPPAASHLPHPRQSATILSRARRPETNRQKQPGGLHALSAHDAEARHLDWCRARHERRARGAVDDRRRRRKSGFRQRQCGGVAAGQRFHIDRRSGRSAQPEDCRQSCIEEFGGRTASEPGHRSNRFSGDRRRLR